MYLGLGNHNKIRKYLPNRFTCVFLSFTESIPCSLLVFGNTIYNIWYDCCCIYHDGNLYTISCKQFFNCLIIEILHVNYKYGFEFYGPINLSWKTYYSPTVFILHNVRLNGFTITSLKTQLCVWLNWKMVNCKQKTQ